jgi:hypothetical protein
MKMIKLGNIAFNPNNVLFINEDSNKVVCIHFKEGAYDHFEKKFVHPQLISHYTLDQTIKLIEKGCKS